MPLFSWVGKTVGPQVVDLSVDILSILLCRGSQIKLDHQQMREEHQAESDLFMDEESLMTEVSSNDKVPNPLVQRHMLVNLDLVDSLGNSLAEQRDAVKVLEENLGT